jgi:isopenicillin N synthase-like dioxygenase
MRTPDIPLFDIGAWRAAGGEERAALAARLDRAMQDSGFFLVSGHGIDDALKERIRESSRAFFALPDTVKQAYVWPAEVPGLREPVTAYAAQVQDLYRELLEVLATALGLEPGYFVERTRNAPHTFNINRYPALAVTGTPLEGQFRVAPHTDWGMLTILDRQPGYGGLQV